MQTHYVEIVTNDVAAVSIGYTKTHSINFSKPVLELGNAITAKLADGSLLGIRAPMHETEEPAVRPYWLVDDIQTALDSCIASGAEIAHAPLELPGLGSFAIYIQGGVMQGLWQL